MGMDGKGGGWRWISIESSSAKHPASDERRVCVRGEAGARKVLPASLIAARVCPRMKTAVTQVRFEAVPPVAHAFERGLLGLGPRGGVVVSNLTTDRPARRLPYRAGFGARCMRVSDRFDCWGWLGHALTDDRPINQTHSGTQASRPSNGSAGGGRGRSTVRGVGARAARG